MNDLKEIATATMVTIIAATVVAMFYEHQMIKLQMNMLDKRMNEIEHYSSIGCSGVYEVEGE